MSDLHYDYLAPSEVKSRQRNFRTHSPDQLKRLCASIRAYGFNQPVAVDDQNRVVCGAGLVAAAKQLGLNRIPVIRLDHLSEGDLRAYSVAANKLADLAGYDEVELGLELADIRELLGSLELPELGIATPELDRLLGLGSSPLEEDAAVLELPAGPSLVQLGDLWQLGVHKLVCASALETASYEQLMGEERAQFGLTDPPYNLSTDAFSTTGRHDDFVQGAGEFSSAEFTRFLTGAMRQMAGYSTNGSIQMFFMSHHFLLELLRAGRIVFDELKTVITWVKPFPGLGSWYRSQSEFVAAFKNGRAPHVNHLGKNGRNRSTVWEYDGLAGFGAGRDELLTAHPTCKPVSLLADAIRDCSDRGGIVLDPFAGSGTLALAAEETGRAARMIELDPRYAEVALRRFQKATGIEPVLASSGATLASLKEQGGR